MRMKNTVTVVGAAAAVLAIAAGGLAAGHAAADRSRAGSVAGVAQVQPLPEGFAADLAGSNITYSDIQGVDAATADQAVQAIGSEFSTVVSKSKGVPIVNEVVFTDSAFGKFSEDENGKATVAPKYSATKAIMVAYPSTPIALAGPPGGPDGFMFSTFVAFVDPSSYKVMRAVSFNEDTQVHSLDELDSTTK